MDAVMEFLNKSCPMWVLLAAGAGVLLLIIVPLFMNRSKWKGKFRELEASSEEESLHIRSKAEKEAEEIKKAAQNEIDIVREEADKKVAEAKKAAQEDIDRVCLEADKKVADIIKVSEVERLEEKEHSKRAMIEAREAIKVDEAELRKADEKQLLIRTVMALSGYGTRLDRLEEALVALEKRSRYPVSSGFTSARDTVAQSSQNSATTPLLDSLRHELNSVAH